MQSDYLEKILNARRGKDGMEATADDHVFFKTFDVATEVDAAVQLDPAQIRAIDGLNMAGVLKTSSYYFSMDVFGRLGHADSSKKMHAVAAAQENKLLYWKEK